ncbi:hypothetical protein F2Q68_00022605 [Brassica cretica]|uniref:Uncharacterized protein n=1 Tax=Brassica cretica TaxID=69181 RepID=A0A8S9FTQ1_BRACR|nr:hypothetical protein F2Q68_00022605 [Brassica cretica]
MAAKSKSLQVIGKHLVNSLRSCAFPRAVASDLSASRYNISNEAGVYLHVDGFEEYLNRSDSNVLQSPTSVAKLPPNTAVRTTRRKTTVKAEPQPSSSQLVNRSCRLTSKKSLDGEMDQENVAQEAKTNNVKFEANVAKTPAARAQGKLQEQLLVAAKFWRVRRVNWFSRRTAQGDQPGCSPEITEYSEVVPGSKQNDNDHEIGDTEIYIDLGDILVSEHANTETNNDNEESKNVQAFDSLVQVEHQETEEAIHENFFENEKTNTLVEAVMNRTDGVSKAEPEEDNSSVDSDGTIYEAGSNQTDNRETEHAIQVNDSETEKTNTLDKDKMVDQTDGDSETEPEGDTEIYVDLEGVVDQTDGDLEGDHSGVDSDVTISEADSNQAVHGIHGSDIVDAKMKSKGSVTATTSPPLLLEEAIVNTTPLFMM